MQIALTAEQEALRAKLREYFAALVTPERRAALPTAPAIATGPKVRMTEPGEMNRTRTYADLLEWPYERDLVEYYTTGQLVTIDVRTRAVRRIGAEMKRAAKLDALTVSDESLEICCDALRYVMAEKFGYRGDQERLRAFCAGHEALRDAHRRHPRPRRQTLNSTSIRWLTFSPAPRN